MDSGDSDQPSKGTYTLLCSQLNYIRTLYAVIDFSQAASQYYVRRRGMLLQTE